MAAGTTAEVRCGTTCGAETRCGLARPLLVRPLASEALSASKESTGKASAPTGVAKVAIGSEEAAALLCSEAAVGVEDVASVKRSPPGFLLHCELEG